MTAAGAGRRASARERGETVESYIAKQSAPRAETIVALRGLVLAEAPDAVESIKWGQPVYEQNGPFAFIKAATAHVTFGFWRGTEIPDPDGLLEGSGAVMRHVKFASAADIPAAAIRPMVREAVALNQRKGDPTKRAG